MDSRQEAEERLGAEVVSPEAEEAHQGVAEGDLVEAPREVEAEVVALSAAVLVAVNDLSLLTL